MPIWSIPDIRGLSRFLRIPSISADGAYSKDVRNGALWLARYLKQLNPTWVRVEATPGHPIVWANWHVASERPTVLIYGHYDVQPADPPSAWASPPFEPVVRGEWLFARGASDNKGQLFAHLKAIEILLQTSGRLPINVVILVDGEEEIGSPNLEAFIRKYRDDLWADAVLISDTSMAGIGQPSITYSLRGSLNAEIVVDAHRGELHSGTFGAAVRNPAEAMTSLLASLHRSDGTIAIPRFYDRVQVPSEMEKHYMKISGPTDATFAMDAGIDHGWGENGYTAYERCTIRPALVITGIQAGYQGTGAKAVLPAIANAKLNLRLVPHQNPQEVEGLLRRYVASFNEVGLNTMVRCSGHAWPVTLERNNWLARAARQACIDGFGRMPVFLRSGGTLPVAGLVQRFLGAPLLLLGFGLPNDHKHAANERLHLPTFARAIKTCSALLQRIAQQFQPGQRSLRVVNKSKRGVQNVEERQSVQEISSW